MNEILYDRSSLLIAGVLLGTTMLAVEAGYRLGVRAHAGSSAAQRGHVEAVQAAVLGLLALLLGFTLSLALQRYDSRSAAVVDEANAIGTAWLRAQLLPEPVREDTQRALRDYLALRVDEGRLALDSHTARERLLTAAGAQQSTLWSLAARAAALDVHSIVTGLYIEALNDVFDAYGRRNAALDRHVPEAVSFVLYGAMIVAAGMSGFAAGIAGHRPFVGSHVMLTLIVVLVFLIVDIDRPRRGIIKVSHASLESLQRDLTTTLGPP